MSAAMVARKHGISSGQFYAWRQQLLLRGALGAGADSVPNMAGIDAARARRSWSSPFLHRRSRALLQRRRHRCRSFNRTTGST